MTAKVKAYAKVNLHLEVLNRRENGYHNIFSLNAALDLYDIIKIRKFRILENPILESEVSIIPDKGRFSRLIKEIPLEDNLIYKAVNKYFNKTNISGIIDIAVEKNIPAGAGLAGGSTDAAAVLNYLNNKCGLLRRNDLYGLAAEIGADVPYCLEGGLAVCEGIGERIEKISGKLAYYVLVANCGIEVNTGRAYKSLNRTENYTADMNAIENKKLLFNEGIIKKSIDDFKSILKNDFEEPVFEEYPQIKDLKNMMLECSPEYAVMTGSGSSVIGLFKDLKRAKQAEACLSKEIDRVYLTQFL